MCPRLPGSRVALTLTLPCSCLLPWDPCLWKYLPLFFPLRFCFYSDGIGSSRKILRGAKWKISFPCDSLPTQDLEVLHSANSSLSVPSQTRLASNNNYFGSPSSPSGCCEGLFLDLANPETLPFVVNDPPTTLLLRPILLIHIILDQNHKITLYLYKYTFCYSSMFC